MMDRRISQKDEEDQENMAKNEKRVSGPLALRGRPSPAEIERLLREERGRRRKRRIAQVREQSKEAARVIRERVKDAKETRLQELAVEELEKYRQEKEVELAVLEEEYQRSLADMGVGHEAAKEHEKYQAWLRESRDRRCEETRKRGMRALRRARERTALDEKIKENAAEVRKSALLAERLRAAQVRRGKKTSEKEEFEFMAEVDDKARKKVTLVSKKRTVDPPTLRSKVRRVPLSEVGNTGLDAAVRQQEEERKARDQAIRRQMEEAKRRGDLALHKERARRDKSDLRAQNTRPTSATISSAAAALSTIDETTEPMSATRTAPSTTVAQVHSSASRPTADDIDLFPVRGPSSSATSPESTRDQEERGLRQSGPVRMGGPTSAFTTLRPSRERDDLDDIRELIDRVERQKRDLATVAVEGSGTGVKNDEVDRNFVAKVLGVPPGALAGDKVRVRVNVEEVSTFEEDEDEATTTTVRRITTAATASSTASSSSDITRERFLTQPLRAAQPTGQRDRRVDEPDFRSMRSLIDEMRDGGHDRSIALRGYIEQLLEMRRDEIDDLSVTTSSLSEGTLITTTTSASSPSSQSFVASTPASILSNSGGKSSSASSSGGSKTVRFIDDVDGSFRGRPKRSETTKEEEEIAERTRASIEEVRRTFEEKKRDIELALAKRFEKKLARQLREQRKTEDTSPTSASSPAQLSEGPLSDTTREEGKTSDSSSSLATNSTKESSLSSTREDLPSPPELASMLKNLRHSWAQSMLRRARNYDEASAAATTAAPSGAKAKAQARANKSSSSGTTTTSSGGSQAVAELRERLARMEMPSLARPRPQGAGAAGRAGPPLPATTSTSDDTFARVAEILSEEVQGEEFSSFHFSPDDDEGDGIAGEKEVSFVSLSTDSEKA